MSTTWKNSPIYQRLNEVRNTELQSEKKATQTAFGKRTLPLLRLLKDGCSMGGLTQYLQAVGFRKAMISPFRL
ncbi:hypothetical protein QFC19_003390 [Naganishia cerealis]|uniref:Uncharacterized protein n=1 Tax=Naganishia cerealis TaxID=610337 RepID=A0ACC2W407_9TREE|nr:hypothetical protein QFC19_003390 [Naganishia cerealis]